MKIAPLLLLVTPIHGFAPVVHRPQRVTFARKMTETSSSETTTSDFASAMPDAGDAYSRLGVEEEKVALGVDPNEILQWLGTRDEIVEKFKRDNSGFTQERAEMEVDKFLMDAEMMSAYINYEKRKASGSLREEAEANLSNPRIWATYAAWFFGIFYFNYFRKTYIDPKFASGEWEEIHIKLPSFFGSGASDAASDAVTSSVTEATTQTVASVIDTLSNSM